MTEQEIRSEYQTVTKMTEAEILKETIEFYGTDPKGRRAIVMPSIGGNVCEYVTADGRNCAVGRVLTPGAKEKVRASCVNGESVDGLFVKFDPNEILDEKYKGQSDWFWSRLQLLHDRNNYWDDKGITRDGVLYVIDFCERIGVSPTNVLTPEQLAIA